MPEWIAADGVNAINKRPSLPLRMRARIVTELVEPYLDKLNDCGTKKKRHSDMVRVIGGNSRDRDAFSDVFVLDT